VGWDVNRLRNENIYHVILLRGNSEQFSERFIREVHPPNNYMTNCFVPKVVEDGATHCLRKMQIYKQDTSKWRKNKRAFSTTRKELRNCKYCVH